MAEALGADAPGAAAADGWAPQGGQSAAGGASLGPHASTRQGSHTTATPQDPNAGQR